MKQFLLFLSLALFFQTNTFTQCPNIDTDNDGVLDCIDPCPNMATSKIGNLSFESDFIGWTIPQNTASFSINLEANNILHGDKSLYITAPNASNFETHSIYSDEFTLEEGVAYNFKIPVKRIGNIDGDALRWVLIDENGIYRHFNNYYSFTEDWTYISFENFLVDFSNFSSNRFRLRLEFGLSTTDMVVDKIEFYESSQIIDPAYLDMDADGNPDCVPFSSENHPDYDALVSFYNALNGDNWNNNTNWLDTTKPLSTWYGITETSGRVTNIKLEQNNLTGSLPITIGDLTNLRVLNLAENNISGEIPKELGNVISLLWIDFQFNSLSGTIPQEFTNLFTLNGLILSHNQLSGAIPDFTQLAILNELWLDNNFFQFGDLEPNFNIYSSNSILNYFYTPQNVLSIPPDSRIINLGDDITFNSNPVTGNNNTYTWYLNGTLIDANNHPNISGLGTPNLSIENITNSELGRYECYVSNAIVTDLDIYAGTFNVGIAPESHPDYDALVALYNALNGPNWDISNHNWLDSTKPISSWWGITETNGRVTGIQLGQGNVRGTIPDEIVNLSELELFWIQSAFVSGEIPENIGNLTKLRQLVLSLTYGLTGSIPASIVNCTNLEWLILTRNQLEGDIPDLSQLENLWLFWIELNNFVFADFETEYTSYIAKFGSGFNYSPQNKIDVTRGVSANIGETVTLNSLPNLGSNTTVYWYKLNNQGGSDFLGTGISFDVPIQSEDDYTEYFYSVTSGIINTLTIDSNRITIGPHPENHPDYNALIAVYNALDGTNWNEPWDITAPIKTWSNWDIRFDDTTNRVNYLSLRGNDKAGQLPKEIGDLGELKTLYIESSENITGSIPSEIGNLSNLESVYLWHCDFSGEVPEELWELSNLSTLFIGHQKSRGLTLSNGIPITISNLQNLGFLDLSAVPISGTLPPQFLDLPNLNYLVLNHCELSGSLPPELASINNLHLLGNNFEGTIPIDYLNTSGNFMLNIRENYFDFNDLEPLVQANNYINLNYSPQRTKDMPLDLEFAPGEDITLTIDDTRLNKGKNSKGVGDNYQWYKDGEAITDTNASSYTITNAQEADSGVYHCEITNTLVPDLIIKRADITLNIDAALSIKDEQGNLITIYPNPTSNHINIKLKSSDTVQMQLYDTQGRKVLSKVLKTQNTIIDIGHLNTGVYILNIMLDDRTVTNRIVKQ